MISPAILAEMAECSRPVAILAASLTERDVQIHFTLLTYSALVAIALVALARTAWRLRDTTFAAPLAWTAISLVAVAAAAIIGARGFGAAMTEPERWNFDIDKWMSIAGLSAFCPTIAVLGAKRPQNRAWQWIVASLWAVVAWPAVSSLVARPHEPLEMHAMWKWFCALLALVGWINYLPTRRGVAITLACIGQIGMLRFWPLRHLEDHNASILYLVFFAYGAMFFALGILMALIEPQRRQKADETRRVTDSLASWNRVWRDYRDLYGAVWGLRFMERVNALAKSTSAQLTLGWRGFRLMTDDTGTSPATGNDAAAGEIAKIEVGMRSLLCRFVSHQWIDARLRTDTAAKPPNDAVLTAPTAP